MKHAYGYLIYRNKIRITSLVIPSCLCRFVPFVNYHIRVVMDDVVLSRSAASLICKQHDANDRDICASQSAIDSETKG